MWKNRAYLTGFRTSRFLVRNTFSMFHASQFLAWSTFSTEKVLHTMNCEVQNTQSNTPKAFHWKCLYSSDVRHNIHLYRETRKIYSRLLCIFYLSLNVRFICYSIIQCHKNSKIHHFMSFCVNLLPNCISGPGCSKHPREGVSQGFVVF